MNLKNKQIWIVGGGISGLATAYYLKQHIQSRNLPWSIAGIESSERLGGVIQTQFSNDCLIERGPDCFSTDRPAVLELCRELGLEDELIEINPSARGLWLREEKRLYELPPDFCGLTSMNLSTLAKIPCLSLRGKIRMACEVFVPRWKSKSEESLGEFISRRFGSEALRRLAQPFLGSIFGADLRQISLSALFPHWMAMEKKHGSLTSAFWAAKRDPSPVMAVSFRTLRGGLSQLIQTLYERSDVPWLQGEAMESLSRQGEQHWHLICGGGDIFAADAVCLAVPARKAAILLQDSLPVLANHLDEQPVRSLILVNATFRIEDWPQTLQGSGIISGLDKAYDLQGASFSSFKFEGRSNPDTILVRLFASPLKADRNAKKTDREIQNEVINDFCSIAKISGGPLWSEVVRYDSILPSYDLNYMPWKKNVAQSMKGVRGLYFSGQSYQPGGLAGCVISARQTAEKMVADLLAMETSEQATPGEEVVCEHA